MANTNSYNYYDLTGGVDTRSSQITLNQNTKHTFWSDSKNIEIYKNGGVARMQGNTEIISLPDNRQILGMFEYIKGDESFLVINTCDGKFYEYDFSIGELSQKKIGLSTIAKCNYANYLNGVICANGVDDPFFYEHGGSPEIQQCNAVRNDSLIKGPAIAVFKGHLWIGYGSTLYYSALGRFNDWETAEDAGYISNFHNDSSEIIALKNYKGYLAIYKRDQTYLLSGNDSSDFVITPFADKGSCSFSSIASSENKQFFCNDGVYTLEQVGDLNQIRLSSEVSKFIHNEFNKFDKSRFDEVIVLPYDKKRQIWFWFPYTGVEALNTCWVFDYGNNAWFKRVITQNVTSACVYDSEILIGTADGKILKEDQGNSFDGEAIDFYWNSPFFHFGQPNKSKTVDEFYLTVDNAKDNNFNFATRKDSYLNEFHDNDLILIAEADYLFWSDDSVTSQGKWDECIWTPESEITERFTISGSHKSMQICLSGNQPEQNFAVIGFEFRDVLLDE